MTFNKQSFSEGWHTRKREVILFFIIGALLFFILGFIVSFIIFKGFAENLAVKFLNADCPSIIDLIRARGIDIGDMWNLIK